MNHGPLFRARLVSLDDAEHRLYLTAHQSIVDGITVFDIFPSELTALYESFAEGKPSPLPPLESQYADFADWQRRSITGEAMEKQLAYWQGQLTGELPILRWPNNGARPPQQTFRGALHPFKLTQELTESLRDLGRREGATLFMILLAGLVALLHRYTRQEDIIVGTLAPSGRKQIEFQRLLGYFLNPVALRANLSGDPSLFLVGRPDARRYPECYLERRRAARVDCRETSGQARSQPQSFLYRSAIGRARRCLNCRRDGA